MKKIQKHWIQEGSWPLIFGILSRSQDHYGTGNLTTELWAEGEPVGANVLGALAGCCPKSDVLLAWSRPPQLFFFQGDTGEFAYKFLDTTYGSSTTQYTYPHTCLGAFFLKNPTDAPITSTFQAGGSSAGTAGANLALYALTPDATGETLEETVLATGSAAGEGALADVTLTVPANTTVAVVLQTCANYKSTTNAYYVLFEQWLMSGIQALITAGLTFDRPMTIRAWQCPGYATPQELWAKRG